MQKYTILTVEYDFYALCALIVMLLLPVVLTCIAEVWTKVRKRGRRREAATVRERDWPRH
jgi:hypothetical protein